MFVALFIQHAKRLRPVILPYVPCLVVPYFSTFSHSGMIFEREKKVAEHKMCFDFLYISAEIFVFLRRFLRRIITNIHRSSYKLPVILVRF